MRRNPTRSGAALSRLVGRDEAVAEVLEALREVDADGRPAKRLITLGGPSGIGKTRMAQEVMAVVGARGRRTAFVYLADLDEAQDHTPQRGDLDLDTIARKTQEALGITDVSSQDPVDVLVTHLARQPFDPDADGLGGLPGEEDLVGPLLVLDNCEKVRDAVGDLAAILLSEAPSLQILATSKMEVGLPLELLIPLAPLSIPGEHADVDDASESTTLLLHLVTAAGRGIPREQLPDALDLARWSGGLPLVLEFIAARIKSGLPPAVVLQRLAGGALLTSRGTRRPQPHHKTLRMAQDDTYLMCTESERVLLGRVAVFTGGCDLEDVEHVCSGDGIDRGEVIDLLGSLVDNTMLQVDTGTGRYRMLPPTRDYALSKLRERGDEPRIRGVHARHFSHLARLAADTWLTPGDGPDEVAWLALAARELDNFRSAMAWLRDNDEPELGLEIALNLARLRFWWFSGLLPEGGTWLKRLMERCPPDAGPLLVSATAMRGWILLCQGDHEEAASMRDNCRDLVSALGLSDRPPAAADFVEGAYGLLARGEPESLVLLRRAVEKYTAAAGPAAHLTGDKHQATLVLSLGAGLIGSDEREAESTARRCMTEAHEGGAQWAESWALWAAGLVPLLFGGDPEDAVRQFQAGLRTQVALGDKWGSAWSGTAIYWALARTAVPELTATLYGGAVRQQVNAGSKVNYLIPLRDQTTIAERMVIDKIGQRSFTTHYDTGWHLPTDEVYALALRPPTGDTPPTAPRATGGWQELTPHQQRIALLIARGLSNEEIAREVKATRRTVETHLSRVYTKLRVPNRLALAAWVVQQTPAQPRRQG
ncbi:LuxR C-terminal-related transcriptional regulator [Umezawaea endophytica]|uniref:LuxR C-terminal-related transcriptional regulator n=1 Tax=Umezawaea endophytica TaxID=1654476 RepID=A0A9X3A4L5_9PSEU|nr:LuxR C-terminal-related transcriptional regulator [Umezawaea endophytica]MCS7482939.1 LuxR C-terminal-related transcriptional regulator [Umezawaea endophytica]